MTSFTPAAPAQAQRPPKQFTAAGLTPGSIILVSGTVVFSQIRNVLEGERLEAAVRREKERTGTRFPANYEHTSITIGNFQVLSEDVPYERGFLEERAYRSEKNPQYGLQYTARRAGRTLPGVYCSPNQDGHYVPDNEPLELAPGQQVVLRLRVFASRKGNNGIVLDDVFIIGQPQYYRGGADNEVLARFGIVVDIPADSATAPGQAQAPAQAPVAPVNTAPQTAPTAYAQQAPAPAAAQQVQMPAGSEVRGGLVMPSAPQPQPAATAPVQAPAPVPQVTLEEQLRQAAASAPAPGTSAFQVPADEDPWSTGEDMGIHP